jgi:hypothetical protein
MILNNSLTQILNQPIEHLKWDQEELFDEQILLHKPHDTVPLNATILTYEI